MLKVVHEESESSAHVPAGVGGSLLDELVRDGARAMLAAALQAEVAAYVNAYEGEVDEAGHRVVVRNGYHQAREVMTAAGAVPVRAPRVNDKRTDEGSGERMRFSSAILPAWARKSPQVAEVLPLLYLHGLSSSDFGPALEPGSRAAGIAMAFKLMESAQHRWRAVNAPHLVALVRAGARFDKGKLVERPDESGGDQQVA